MKGKKADASERRRQIEALEKRAETAERQVGKLTAELADVREKTDRQISGLRREIADLIRQRDAATSPLLDKSHAELESMRQQLKQANVDKAAYLEAIDRFQKHVRVALSEAGLSKMEISVIISRYTGEIRDGIEGVFMPMDSVGGDVLLFSTAIQGKEAE